MIMVIESTSHICDNVNGHSARLWHGVTAQGEVVYVFVALIAVPEDSSAAEFEAELKERGPFVAHMKEGKIVDVKTPS
jgi:hypothetical protein